MPPQAGAKDDWYLNMRLVSFTLAGLAGILLGHWLRSLGLVSCAPPIWPPGALVAILLLVCWLCRGDRLRLTAASLALALVLGAWRYQASPLEACLGPGDLAYYNGAQNGARATVEGVVTGYPEIRDTQIYCQLHADRLTLRGRTYAVQGDVLVRAPRYPPAQFGDRLVAAGQLADPPVFTDFDYRAYLARQGIRSELSQATISVVAQGQGSPLLGALYYLRDLGAAALERDLPEPMASLAAAMLLGIRTGIPADLSQAFADSGTSHLIVISGTNIAFLCALLLAALGRPLSRRWAASLAWAVIALYILMVGAGPSALRAGIMGALALGALLAGRQSLAWIGLAAATLLMCALNPLILWDPAFQIGGLATAGMILFAARLKSWFGRLGGTGPLPGPRGGPPEWRRRLGRLAGQLLAPALAAQITTLPLLVCYFGQVSLVALFANVVVAPAQPLILASGMAALAAGLVWPPLGQALAALTWLFLAYVMVVVRAAATLPFPHVAGGPWGLGTLALCYLGLAGAVAWHRMAQTGRWPRLAIPPRRAAWLAGLALPALLLVAALGGRPDGRLHIFFVPGQAGEAVLIVTPGGHSAFAWDGHGDGAALAAAARAHLPGLRQDVDAVVGGATSAALWPAAGQVDPGGLAPGQALQLDRGVLLARVPGDAEPVLALTYGSFRMLLPPALSQEAQASLIASGDAGPLTVLKAPGPGEGAWPASQFVAAAAPQAIVWPEDTTYPPEVSAALQARGAAQVPAGATVEAITDGRQVWVKLWSDEPKQ